VGVIAEENWMKEKLARKYNPGEHEERLYSWWEAQGFFRPETQAELGSASADGPRWCMTMPPPNVTGALHLGHAMVAAVEDLMTRYYRMRGRQTLYLPGSDHAGIATQNVVERELRKEGLSRHDLGREEFVKRVWDWKDFYHGRITAQHKRLGISCDWSRERFTLDEGLSHAVRTAFVRLYEKGLIHRGTYLVNWCPRCESAISDLEVIPDERPASLWYIRYPVITKDWEGPPGDWGSGDWAEGAARFIEMATTRPETILGDTAVAVSPQDPRWREYVGQTAVLPAIGRQMPILADDVVDPEFGTGAVKVTPAHDPTDNEIGLRHGLEAPDVMTDDGRMSELAGPYAGQERFECRASILADFRREGLLVREEPYFHAVGTCQRCGTDIEPRVSTQWFVKTKPLAEAAMSAVREGSTRIVPEREERRFFHWMENIRDWCISRQLWWGHRIPVWYCQDCGGETSAVVDPTECSHCGSREIRRDEDVLDTWFSSGLWPFSTLGWPHETEDYERYYPTDMRETAYDILFFWVAREMMLGIELTGRTPYETVYLHGLVRNEEGKKISKSMENIDEYDPLNLIDKYGADALRYMLLTSSTPGLDMNLDPRRLEGARNFTNKIWQAARFVLSGPGDERAMADLAGLPLELTDRWILSRINRLVAVVTRLFEAYEYGEAGRQIYDFLWGEFCDWYIEASKVRLYDEECDNSVPRACLLQVLSASLRLLHPFAPFVTEAIWQAFPESARPSESVMMSPWPAVEEALLDEEAESRMGLMIELVRGIRNVRAEYGVTPGKRIGAMLAAGGEAGWLEEQRPVLCALAKLDDSELEIGPALPAPEKAATVVAGEALCYVPLAALLDLDAERERLNGELEEIEVRIARSEALLAGEFAKKAPPEIVDREREKVGGLKGERDKLRSRLAEFA
jgi:valyl-tRNA synthetase